MPQVPEVGTNHDIGHDLKGERRRNSESRFVLPLAQIGTGGLRMPARAKSAPGLSVASNASDKHVETFSQLGPRTRVIKGGQLGHGFEICRYIFCKRTFDVGVCDRYSAVIGASDVAARALNVSPSSIPVESSPL